MKHTVKPLLLLLLYNHAFAQSSAPKQPTQTPIAAYKPAPIPLKISPQDSTAQSSLFSHFEVLDLRPDTQRIGIHYTHTRADHSYNRQLVFAHPAATEISSFLDSISARKDAPYTALIVLRTLWISDPNYIREDLVRDPERRFEKSHIRLKAEVYAAKDNHYIPLLRFDSLQVSYRNVTYDLYGQNLADMLNYLADSALRLLPSKMAENRVVSLEDIRQFNQSRFELPIYHDIRLNKGVYNSFEEFKNNTPSIRNYEIKEEDHQLLLYIKEEGGKSYYCRTAWGYCDGQNVFVMKNGALHLAWKEDNALYMLGMLYDHPTSGSTSSTTNPVAPNQPLYIGAPTGIPMLVGNVAASSIIDAFKYDAHIHVFMVDMDNGNVY